MVIFMAIPSPVRVANHPCTRWPRTESLNSEARAAVPAWVGGNLPKRGAKAAPEMRDLPPRDLPMRVPRASDAAVGLHRAVADGAAALFR